MTTSMERPTASAPVGQAGLVRQLAQQGVPFAVSPVSRMNSWV
jgi:hypothetical protein